jgi:hypothetical protein
MRKQFIVVSVIVLVVVFIGTITWTQQRPASSIPTHCEQIGRYQFFQGYYLIISSTVIPDQKGVFKSDTQTGDIWVSMRVGYQSDSGCHSRAT